MTMRRMGAEAVSFPPIVAAGPHGALPHASPRDAEIPRGTLCVVDWGAQLDGYASRLHADLRDRRQAGPARRARSTRSCASRRSGRSPRWRPGPSGREVDAVARDIITAAGHGEHFGHGLGHGVGAEVHEGPRLSQRSEATLEAGNVVTVEPGVYVPGAVGVRIEDLVVVTDDGHEVLTTIPKALRTIG